MLFKRNGIFYFRQSIPLELRKRFAGNSEIKKSLKTGDRKEAKISAAAVSHTVEFLFFAVRWKMISDEQAVKIRSRIIAETMENLSRRCADDDFFSFIHEKVQIFESSQIWIPEQEPTWSPDQVLSAINSNINLTDYVMPPVPVEAIFKDLDNNQIHPEILKKAILAAKECQVPIHHPIIDEPTPQENIPINTFLYKDLINICIIVVKTYLDISVMDRYRGGSAATDPYTTELQRELTKSYKDGLPPPKLSELWEAYYQDKITRKEWRVRTAEKYSAAFNIILDILGDIPIDHCDSHACLKLTKGLQKYPANKNKLEQFRGKAFTLEMSKMKGFKKLSVGSINFHIGMISGIFNFALEDRRRWRIDQNPFAKKQIKDECQREVDELRREFTREEIEQIFVELSKVRRLVEPEKFWVPLICLYSGMRINEACQLRTDDIEVKEGIPAFQIYHRPKLFQETKNGKPRTVPIHITLQSIGFLDFVNDQKKKKTERLFPRLELFKGKWHRKVDNWFNRTVLRSHMKKTDNDRVSFHSTKHTFINWFVQNVGVEFTELRLLKMIAAHLDNKALDARFAFNSGGITVDRYGKKYTLDMIYEFINKLDYKVDLSLLSK